jgi:ferrous iron transport protein B
MVDAKYAFVQGALAETYAPNSGRRKKSSITDKIDSIVTNRWLAFPIFFFLLYIVFDGTFVIGEHPMRWIEWLIGHFGAFVGSAMADGWFKDLIIDGVIGGVGSVLVFLPNILLLYMFISLLEDSGYMARAAFIMDRLMHRIGLHGKSFIPMIMGFGCNVPAVMATRTIESRKSRLITMLIIPLMSCAGRMPVYILIAGAFFHKKAAMIKWEQVEEYIGHAPGGVCPFGIKEGVKVYLDNSLLRFKTVYAAAGEANATIALSPEELFETSGAIQWIDVCKLPGEE